MIKTIRCEVKGTSALLMHRFPMVPLEAIEKKSSEEQAEFAAYRDETTSELYVPGINIQRCLVSAATFSKGKGRASLQKQTAAGVFVDPERVLLGTKTYQIDSRAVVVPATKGRVVRHRPRIDEWRIKFNIDFEDKLMTETQLRRIVDDAGQLVGLLDFRPERKGPFGRFMVSAWDSKNGQ